MSRCQLYLWYQSIKLFDYYLINHLFDKIAFPQIIALLVTVPFGLMGNFSIGGWEELRQIIAKLDCSDKNMDLNSGLTSKQQVEDIAETAGRFMMLAIYTGLFGLLISLCYYMHRPNDDLDESGANSTVAKANEDGLPLVVNPPTKLNPFQKWWRRGRILLILLTCSLVTLIVGCLGTANIYYQYFMFPADALCQSLNRRVQYPSTMTVILVVFGIVWILSL
jgi:hypothetical protein